MFKLIYISALTNSAVNEKIDKTIDKYCKEYTVSGKKVWIEKALVKAIIKQESKFNPLAMRYERHLKQQAWYNKWIPDKYKDDKFAYMSMGLMQILYGTARSHGFKGSPEYLNNIENSIKYGCIHIAWLINKYYTIERVISAYNAGHPTKKNARYTKNVLKYYREFGGKIKID